MKSFALSLAALVTLLPSAYAVGAYGQCGGINYTGSTTCDAGLTCVVVNAYYYQCQPSATSTTSSKAATSSTSTKVSSTTTSSKTTSTTAAAVTGYVKTSGQKFSLNGATFNVVGTNAYFLAQLSSSSLITQAMSEIAQAGTTVLRTWGFADVTSTSSGGTYYQSWSGSVATVNTGANGLQKFDQVVAAAKAAGIRLVVPLTNNWTDYGGMDLYVSQILGSGQAHSNFYTNTAIQTAYKNYVNTFVTRYKNEPTIMAWELANEPRCTGCATSVVTTWAKTMSAYIKSIDTNHLVAMGDEGFFNQAGNSEETYNGTDGMDFAANLAISTLDYGTFHLYPITWGFTSGYQAWGVQWIIDHASAQKTANKPTVMEEYGVTTSDRSTVYAAWWSQIISSGISGDQYWQAGTSASGSGYNDGYAIFTTDSIFPAVQQHEAAMKARS